MIKKLPVFKGLTVDFRLRQFRLCNADRHILGFIDFDTDNGIEILTDIAQAYFELKAKENISLCFFCHTPFDKTEIGSCVIRTKEVDGVMGPKPACKTCSNARAKRR